MIPRQGKMQANNESKDLHKLNDFEIRTLSSCDLKENIFKAFRKCPYPLINREQEK